jgi:flagellar protein FlgJ
LPVSRTERFRAYDSPAASFRDYVALLRDNPRYEGALGKGADTHAFAQALQKAGYATDPNYAHKLTATAQAVRQLDATRAFKIAADQPLNTGTIPF